MRLKKSFPNARLRHVKYRRTLQLPTPFDVEWFISEIKIRGAVPANMLDLRLACGFGGRGGIEAKAQKPGPWSLRPDNTIGGPAGGRPESQPFHNSVRNRTWCEVQTESWGALGSGILDTGHFVADAGYGFIQVGVSLTGYYLPNHPNPSGFFNLTQGEAVRALVEGPFIGLDDIFTGDGQKACQTLGGALAFASIGRMLRRGKCGEAEAPLPPSLPTAKPPLPKPGSGRLPLPIAPEPIPLPIVRPPGLLLPLIDDVRIPTTHPANIRPWHPLEGNSSCKKIKAMEAQIRCGKDFDPVTVVEYGGQSWLRDGHHRCQAYRRCGKEVPNRVIQLEEYGLESFIRQCMECGPNRLTGLNHMR